MFVVVRVAEVCGVVRVCEVRGMVWVLGVVEVVGVIEGWFCGWWVEVCWVSWVVGMGWSSWGGFESLAVYNDLVEMGDRRFFKLEKNQHLIRIHIGLEDPNDLINDLKRSLKFVK